MKATSKINKLNIVLAAACLSLLVCVSLLILSYVKLQQAYPLENLRGAIMQPVVDSDEFIEFKGTYDRYVQCNMTTFDVNLYNTETQDVITLTPQHLAKPLPTLIHPGENTPISVRNGGTKVCDPVTTFVRSDIHRQII